MSKQPISNPNEKTINKFSMPDIEKSGCATNATTAKLMEALKKGEGLTTQTARKLIFENEDQDHDGKKTRKALRSAQAKLRLAGFKTVRLSAGVQKIYFAYQTDQDRAELDQLAKSKGLNITEIK